LNYVGANGMGKVVVSQGLGTKLNLN